MSHTPSVHTEADGTTTVTNGLTATDVQTPIAIPDPTAAPIIAAVDPDGVNSFALVARRYGVSYAWQTNGYTIESPRAELSVDGSKAISVTVPAPPDGATGTVVFFDNGLNLGDFRSGPYIPLGDPLTVFLPVMTDGDWSTALLVGETNWTGRPSNLNSDLVVQGPLTVGENANIAQDISSSRSVVEWNASVVPTQPAITGALSAVTDAAAKAVLTSILAVLVNKGSATDGTT